MIYVDEPWEVPIDLMTAPSCFRGRLASHLCADTEEELRAYAVKIGMKESWIQYPGTPRVHYDLVGAMLVKVLKEVGNGVTLMSRRELAAMTLARRTNASTA